MYKCTACGCYVEPHETVILSSFSRVHRQIIDRPYCEDCMEKMRCKSSDKVECRILGKRENYNDGYYP